jgi:glycine/D-amino acid oxidase-like deaminating enzyme
MSLPSAARFVIIGAGVHGLSTAWHLAKDLKARRLGDGTQIVVLDKTKVGAGASGIACGVIRNNYFQPAMRELMAHSVGIWESDPDAFSYHPVGIHTSGPARCADHELSRPAPVVATRRGPQARPAWRRRSWSPTNSRSPCRAAARPQTSPAARRPPSPNRALWLAITLIVALLIAYQRAHRSEDPGRRSPGRCPGLLR